MTNQNDTKETLFKTQILSSEVKGFDIIENVKLDRYLRLAFAECWHRRSVRS